MLNDHFLFIFVKIRVGKWNQLDGPKTGNTKLIVTKFKQHISEVIDFCMYLESYL